MEIENYSEVELNNILAMSIDEFRKLLNDEGNGFETLLPEPNKFRYLHEFNDYDHTKGGILIVGLNPHIGENENESKWREKYNINERNTSDCLLTKYSYFKKFTDKSDDGEGNEKYNMDLLSVNPNVKFTDVILIRTSSKKKLLEKIKANAKETKTKLTDAIALGWETYMEKILNLVMPQVMVCNSVVLSRFLEKKAESCSWEKSDDLVKIKLQGFVLPCVLSGQVTGKRATDKWALIRLRNSIINAMRS